MRVTVVGGGVIGLTCAVRLAEAGHDMRLVTAMPAQQTTSAVAGGLWYPYRADPPDAVAGWAAHSQVVLRALAREPLAGVTVRAGRELLRRPGPTPFWASVTDLRRLEPGELPPGYADGFTLTAPVVDMGRYLRWLQARLSTVGVVVEARRVASLDDVDGDVVVNATGLGAAALTGDNQLTPVRGQVVRLARPEAVREWVLDEEDPAGLTYVLPRVDDVVCGGTAEAGQAAGAYDHAVERAILRRCQALVPALAGAPVLSRAIGWRPVRTAVRLEREGRVVHCYGHGGAGVTLSWGCARDVVDLVG